MAENQRCARRGRTHFQKEQVQALKRVFEETMYPDWNHNATWDLFGMELRWGSSWYSLPPDLQQICLGDSDPPWASSPYDIDQFMERYALPGDDDPRSLDQFLSPTCLG
uniref:paired-like homeodomain transcription factor LEUTX n=1 Tax=Nyctereutes procyonoides TaxID=34880 RepID=UPI002444E42C|nr:paired-like homeodomain transcription factor LEUTX [Nyctereutes procyonoides]